MNPFLRYLYENPFFAGCFIFYSIPFWVPLLGIFAGADTVLMLLLSALSLMAKSYIRSEILAANPFDMMFNYFVASPAAAVSKFLLAALLVVLAVIYGGSGTQTDAWIAAAVIVFGLRMIYFGPKKNPYWNIRGVRMYRLYELSGRLLSACIWIFVMAAGMSVIENILFGFTAVFVTGLTFYKTNEGLI